MVWSSCCLDYEAYNLLGGRSDMLWPDFRDGQSRVQLGTFKLVMEMEINTAWFDSVEPKVLMEKGERFPWRSVITDVFKHELKTYLFSLAFDLEPFKNFIYFISFTSFIVFVL